jgi:hypothetical protein
MVEGKLLPLGCVFTRYASLLAAGLTLPFGELAVGGSRSPTFQMNDASTIGGTHIAPLSQFLTGMAVTNADLSACGTTARTGWGSGAHFRHGRF